MDIPKPPTEEEILRHLEASKRLPDFPVRLDRWLAASALAMEAVYRTAAAGNVRCIETVAGIERALKGLPPIEPEPPPPASQTPPKTLHA